MQNWVKQNIVTILVIIVTVLGNYLVSTAMYSYRLGLLEARQDHQDAEIASVQVQVSGLSSDISGIKATINSISETVNYIRNRIDKVSP